MKQCDITNACQFSNNKMPWLASLLICFASFQAGNDDEEMGFVRSLIDDEYTQALSEMRVDLSME